MFRYVFMCFCKIVRAHYYILFQNVKLSSCIRIGNKVADLHRRCCTGVGTTMNFQSAINKEIFTPCDERLLVAVEVQRRKRRRRMSFLPRPKGDYNTYICVSG